MKNILRTATCIIAMFIAVSVQAQTAEASGPQEVKIKTSAVCGSCKKTIEKAVKSVEGVESATVTLSDNIATVKYDAAKTNPDAIRLAINNAGYDADENKATKEAYDKLDGCCKKE